jgi:hypothetical protein
MNRSLPYGRPSTDIAGPLVTVIARWTPLGRRRPQPVLAAAVRIFEITGGEDLKVRRILDTFPVPLSRA